MAWGLAQWFIYGEVDWSRLDQQVRSFCPLIAGVIFGAGWWCWVDAIVYSKSINDSAFPFKFWLPGIISSLALVLMNLVSRDDLASMSDYYSSEGDGAETRAKCWLFISYLIAFGAVAGSVAVLVTCVQQKEHIWVGVGGLLQCGCILCSGLLLWAFRTSSDSEEYGTIY